MSIKGAKQSKVYILFPIGIMQSRLTRHRFTFNIRQWMPEKHQWMAAYEAIQDEERTRISQFVFKEDAKSSLIGRVLLRYMICQLTDVLWDKVFLQRSRKGKPNIDYGRSCEILRTEYPKISINVSHSGDYVIGVIDKTQLVGVDIMDTRNKQGDVSQFFGVMKRNFTPEEWNCINNQRNDEEKMKSFYRHWCLKESFVKAIGKGIGYSLQKLSFNIDPRCDTKLGELHDKTTLDIHCQKAQDWYFEETMIDCHHCVAVATRIDEKGSSEISSVHEPFTELHFCDFQNYLLPLSPITEDLWTDFDKKLTKMHKNIE